VKLFKYLDFHPQMTVLINTLKKGAKPLGFFMFTMVRCYSPVALQ